MHSTPSEVDQSQVHQSEEYPTYLHLGVFIFLSKAGASTVPSIGNATLTMDWRGRAREREVKLQLFGDTGNPYHGLAWSNARTRGKVATFRRDGQPLPRIGVVEVKLHFFPTFRRHGQPLPWIGVVERASAR